MAVTLVIIAYVVGTIPFALWLGRRMGGGDLRRAGSGNPGATNVLRTAGASTALLVLLLDMTKGAAGVAFAERMGASLPWIAGASAAVVCGHVFPVWLRFRGGKGVATAGGAFLVLTPVETAISLAVFTTVVWRSRYVSLGSLSAALVLPLLAMLDGRPAVVVAASLGVSGLIVSRHRANIERLWAGRERRLGERAR